jgi:putative SOS response-associated peptidase YedK
LFEREGSELFAFAGLFSRWRKQGQDLLTCTLITTTPNPLVAPIHNRMPAMLDRSACERWLSPATQEDALLELLHPFAETDMTERPVSRSVSNPANDSPELLIADTASGSPGLFG